MFPQSLPIRLETLRDESIAQRGQIGVRTALRRTFILALVLSFGLGLTGAAIEYQWNIEVVGAGQGHLSMIRASDGTLHACFPLDNSPRYAYRDENGWSAIEIADPENLVGAGFLKIGLNAAGYPVIVYQKAGQLWVAVRSAEGWATELVDARSGAGRYIDMAVDSSGRYHILYSFTSGALHYALFDGLEWTLEQLRTVEETGTTCGIAIDSSGYPHVSYWAHLEGGMDALGYGFQDELGWHFETVDGPKFDLGACRCQGKMSG